MQNLPEEHQNTFCGYTFICPICGRRDCAWRRLLLDENEKLLRDEMFCTETDQVLTSEAILQALLKEWGDSLPASVWITLGEKAPDSKVSTMEV